MDIFTVDRQFGLAIFIDVENGIVQKCYNETERFNAKMEEHYKGKPISFLKTDFEARMKPSYHNVRCEAILSAVRTVAAFESRISNQWTLSASNDVSAERRKLILENIKELEYKASEARGKLFETRERIKTEHNYEFNF